MTVNREYNTYIYSAINHTGLLLTSSRVEEEIDLVVGDRAPLNLINTEEIQKFSHQVFNLYPSEIKKVLNFVFGVVSLQAGVFK